LLIGGPQCSVLRIILTPGRRTQWTVWLAAGLLAVTACGGDDDSAAGADAGPYVVATTGIWADVVGKVACDGTFGVRTLLPTGTDSHAYEPSLGDRRVLDGAALVVANGLGLEERLDDTLDTVEDGGVPVLRIGDHVATLAEEDEEGHPGADPHVWFDPTRVSAALPALGDALVAAGADDQRIGTCVAATQDELADLDAEIADTLAVVPAERRVLVTNHDSLGYFADRYDFTVLGSILPSTSTLTEASPGQLEALGEAIETEGVPAIFAESVSSTADADALAERLGVDVVVLYTESLGEPGSGAETYADFMRYDAQAIADALS
jgi:zinc/manganese transport system substrate-binding protein